MRWGVRAGCGLHMIYVRIMCKKSAQFVARSMICNKNVFLIFCGGLGGDGSPSRARTCDNSINSRMLYQLSYRGSPRWAALGRPVAGHAYIKRFAGLPRPVLKKFKKTAPKLWACGNVFMFQWHGFHFGSFMTSAAACELALVHINCFCSGREMKASGHNCLFEAMRPCGSNLL